MSGESDNQLAARIVARAGIPGSRRRRDVERELRSHIEDVAAELRAEGCAPDDVADRIAERLGDPAEIARAFSAVYAAQRAGIHALVRAAQLLASVAVVGAIISGVQLLAGFGHAELAPTLAKLRFEIYGFAALACGYVGSIIADRAAAGRSTAQRTLVCGGFVVMAAGCLTAIAPGHILAPAVACTSAAMVRWLELGRVRFAPLLGSAGPLLSAWALVRPAVVGTGHVPPIIAPLIVTLDVAVACRAMSWLAARVDRHFIAAHA